MLSPPCSRSGQDFACRYNHILGDNQEVPTQPNLNGGDSNNDIGKFLVWQGGTHRPYIVFTFSSSTTVTTINIEFLNYPAQNFSLPNLQLYATAGLITNPNSPSAQPIDFDIVNNSGLSQGNHKVTNISLIFSSTSQSILLYWDYTDVYNLDVFMVSEVDFCNGTPPVSTSPIAFQQPQMDSTVVVPTVDDFIASNNFLLTCTVSVSGLFEWQWRQNETLISNNANFHMFTADGTRTSKLQLTGLSVTDAASCSQEFGSDVNGKCRCASISGTGNNICNGTSVLNDGIIPALGGVSQETNSEWAAQLFTMRRQGNERIFVSVEVPHTHLDSVLLTVFNCPQQGIYAPAVNVYSYSSLRPEITGSLPANRFITNETLTATSCDHLIKFCVNFRSALSLPYYILEFPYQTKSDFVFLNEVTFSNLGGANCPPPELITMPVTPPSLTTTG